jgi:O-methyltransferase
LRRRLESEFSGAVAEINWEAERFLEALKSREMVEQLASSPSPQETVRHRYLWLLKRALVNLIYPEHELRIEYFEESPHESEKNGRERFLRDIGHLRSDQLDALRSVKADGRVWRGKPSRFSHTMVGLLRLDNLERCAEAVFRDGVTGDFVEAGVCQGGAAIFLRALQVAYGESERRLWAADSFQGLPKPSMEPDLAQDMDFSENRQPWLSWDLASVADHFRRYDLLDDGVRFLQGWFSDTLPQAPVERIALLRIDADLYQSTREVLMSLYDRVSPGGYVIVDDYGAFEPCRKAVDEFRQMQGIDAPMHRIDWTGVFWRKQE